MSLPTLEASPGASLTVPLTINDAARVAGGNFVVRFDPALLTATSPTVTTTALTTGFALTVNTNEASAGRLRFALARSTALNSGSGALVNLHFTVNAAAAPGASSALEITEALLFDEQAARLPVTALNGRFTIPAPPSPPPQDTPPAITAPVLQPTTLPRQGGAVTLRVTVTDDKGVVAAWALINGSIRVPLTAHGSTYTATWKAPRNKGKTAQQHTVVFYARDTKEQETSLAAGSITVEGKRSRRRKRQSLPDPFGGEQPAPPLEVKLLGVQRGAMTLLLFRLNRPAQVVARLLSPTGKVVRQLSARPVTAGVHALTWDGKGQRGEVLPRGAYLLELRAQDETGHLARIVQVLPRQ